MSGKLYLHHLLICVMLFFLSACEKVPSVEMPPPQTLTREASGYYCLMTLANHEGPKGHIILTDNIVHWFSSVRDTISFVLSPEESKNIAAIYVNDMSDADWENPGIDNWIDARKAWYVIESNRNGGMGSAEAIPFSTKVKAEEFALKHDGKIKTFDTIPKDYIFKTKN